MSEKHRSQRDRPAPGGIHAGLDRLLREAREARARGRYRDAVELYQRVLAANPRSAQALGELGYTVAIAGEPRKGAGLVQQALAQAPGSPDLNLFMADLLARYVGPGEALPHIERAVAADPRRSAALRLGATCLERLNRVEEALAYARRAVEADGRDPYARLALAKLEARSGHLGDARVRLEELTAPGGDAGARQEALTELGFVLDRLGEPDAAYDAFERAGREVAALPAVKRMNARLPSLRVEAYRGRVTPELVSRFAGERFDTPAPIFLVGFPRSGTTMTEQVLAAHPQIRSSDERPLLDGVLGALMEGADDRLDVPSRLATIDGARVRELRGRYWSEVRRQTGVEPGSGLFVDKLPLNIIDLGLINTVFPDARVLVALRDPRDVCLSCFMQRFEPNPAMNQFLAMPSTAAFYAAVMGLYLDIRDHLTIPVLEVRYEDTVRDLEPQARRIVDHLGLAWHDGLLAFHEKARERAIRTPSYAAVTEKVHTRAIGRWRRYASRLEPVLGTLAPFVDAFGYADETGD